MNNSLFLHYFSIFSPLYIWEKEEATKDFTKAKKNEYSVRRKLCSRACQDNEVYEDLSSMLFIHSTKRNLKDRVFSKWYTAWGENTTVCNKKYLKKAPQNGQYNNGFETFLAIFIGKCSLKKRNRSAASLCCNFNGTSQTWSILSSHKSEKWIFVTKNVMGWK